MSRRPVNLRQLSEHLGVSQTTVSRALNGFPEVSEKTRQRVEQAARELNYRPSTSASMLATGRSRVIGHVVPIGDHAMINPHFSDFLAGASHTYSENDYDMLLRLSPTDGEEAVYREFAANGRVDGVVVHGPGVDEPRIGLLDELGIPFVVHGRSENAVVDYNWMDVNNRRAFHRATRFLLDLGHRRIALVNGLETMNFAHRRRAGYVEALQEAGIAIDATIMTSADLDEPYGYEATLGVLSGPNAPTAIVYASVLSAMGGMRAVSERGLVVGQDVSLVTFDDQLSFLEPHYDVPRRDVPLLTAMRSSLFLAGRKVASMLIDRIENPQVEPHHELWEAELVVGRSTGPVPSRMLPSDVVMRERNAS